MANVGKFARLYVGNLPWTVGHRQLKEYFSQFGPVQGARVVFDKSTGLSKGYGFVEFESKSSVEDAKNKQHHILEGIKLKIQQTNDFVI